MSGNDQAFPLVTRLDLTSKVSPGLTKRELFAAIILGGLVQREDSGTISDGVMIATAFADALIAELNKEQSK